jgi:hypothetical protein
MKHEILKLAANIDALGKKCSNPELHSIAERLATIAAESKDSVSSDETNDNEPPPPGIEVPKKPPPP